jgi:hypothetical protein
MKASKNPVKALYGSAMLIGVVVGLGCGAGKAFSKDAATAPAPKPHFRPHIGPYMALQNVRERQELLRIYDGMLAQLRQRAAVREAKNDLRAQGVDPDSQPLPRPQTAAHASKHPDSDAFDIAPTLVIGARAVQRTGSVETVETPSIETPAYPGQAETSDVHPDHAQATAPAPVRQALGARFAKNDSLSGFKPAWKRFSQR